MALDHRKLYYAIILAAEGNFSRAAKRCHVTQPALSQGIFALESELGVRLFDRGKSGVSLTAEGRTFLQRAREIVRQGQQLKSEMALIRGHGERKLSVGLPPFPAEYFIEPFLSWIVKDCPKVYLKVETKDSMTLIEDLRGARIDFLVGSNEELYMDDRLSVTTLFKCSLEFYVRPGHPLLKKRIINSDSLKGYPILFISMDMEKNDDFLLANGVDVSKAFSPTIHCNNVGMLKNTACETDAVLLAPSFVVGKEVACGRLMLLKSEMFSKVIEFSIFTFKDTPVAAMAQKAMLKFQEICGELTRVS